MYKKSFMSDIEILAKNTAEGLKYYEQIINKFFDIDKKSKGISYMIFDKHYKPYLVMPDNDFYPEKDKKKLISNFKVYAIEKDEEHKDLSYVGEILTSRTPIYHNGRIATSSNARVNELDLLEIVKGKYIFEGLGKQMYYLYEYKSFIMGAIKMKGTAYPLNPAFINRADLYRFYKDRGITVNKKNGKMKKKFDPYLIKEYAKRIATYSREGVVIKVVFPENTKELVMDIIGKEPPKRKTSILSDIKEF